VQAPVLLDTIVTADVFEAAELLKQGELVIFPTETVYGLGADALNPQAVRNIFEAKQRPADNPLIVHIHSLEQVEELAHGIPDYGWKLLEHFFPGGLTLLVPKKPVIPAITTAGSDKVCLRMPSMPITQDFLRACGVPVAAPSANLSGKPSPTRWQDCLEDMKGRVAAILMGEEATHGLESTIVDCSGERAVLMRPGSVTLEALREVVPDILPKPSHSAPVTPGMKYRHYAPKAKVFIVPAKSAVLEGVENFGYIGFNPPIASRGYVIGIKSLEEYARRLFAFFRECDRRGISTIYVEEVAEEGLGLALMNRLYKAAKG
jgi:L-threonylcarbamoyladenylate synthase